MIVTRFHKNRGRGECPILYIAAKDTTLSYDAYVTTFGKTRHLRTKINI